MGCRSGITGIEQIARVKSVLTQPGDGAAGNGESEKHDGCHNLHDSDLHSFLRRKLAERSTYYVNGQDSDEDPGALEGAPSGKLTLFGQS